MVEKLKKYLSGTSRGASGAVAQKLAFRRLVAMVIFGAIILVFVLFGFQGRHTAIGVGSAARVNSAYISVSDLQVASQRMEQIYAQMFGGQMSGEAQRQLVRGQALERLINDELVSQSAKSQGIIVTNNEIREFISKDMPVFQKDGMFRREVYIQLLEANHLTPSQFEDQIRKERSSMRLHHVFESASGPLSIEEEKLKQLKENKINVAFVKLDESQATSAVSISDSEVNTQLTNPEFMKKVEAEFSQNKATYSQVEQVRASHILVKSKAGDAASEKAAWDKITDLAKRAEKEDFGKLAAANTEDFGTKASKGDLGFFSHGKMVPEFDIAAFSQSIGKVGQPVKTAYGYHLIKVTDKKPAMEATLDNSKIKIAKNILAKERIAKSTKNLEEALQKNDNAAVDSAIAGLGLKWDETGFFELGADVAPKISSRLATQAVFEVSAAKPLLGRLVRDGTSSYLIKFKAAKMDSVPSDKNSDMNLSQERSSEMFKRWIESVAKTATIEKNPLVMRE